MIAEVYIGNERLDLFEQDAINIVQNVQDVNDISKISAEFSQSFSVPASNRNNRIFKHFYNPTIDNGFDARINKEGFIMLDGVPFKFGKIRLESVKLENNEPKTYKITFFGDAIKIKELIGDDELTDLTWLDNFDHDYTGAKVKEGLTDGLDFTVDSVNYEQAIIYPLINYSKQYLYNSDVSDTTNTDTLVNIAYDAVRTQGVDYSDLKPAIKCNVILKAIQEQYGLNFLGDFFNTANFNQLYMNLNNSDTTLNAGFLEVENLQNQTLPAQTPDVLVRAIKYTLTVMPKAGFESVPYKAKLQINGNVVYENQSDFVGNQVFEGQLNDFTQPLPEEYSVISSVSSNQDFEFDATTKAEFIQIGFAGSTQTLFTNTYNNQVIDLTVLINQNLPELKVYDWLSSLFKMFNLTVESINKDLYFNDLPTWYAQGDVIDVTKYVDTKSLEVKSAKRFNEFNFKFQESEQIIADEYNINNNIYYGNLEQKIFEDETQQRQIDGEAYDIEVDFENPIFERLLDVDTGALTSIQYCPYINRDLKTISGEPFLLYANQVSLIGNTIGFNDESTYTELSVPIIMPSHTVEIDNVDSFSFNFGTELSEYTYQAMANNSYSTYYSDYIGDLFSIRRRNFILEGILPPSILQNLRLNDRLVIKNTRYIINSVNSNLITRNDKFELINDIYNAPLASDTLNNGVFLPSFKSFNKTATSSDTQYIGLANQTPTLVDNGFGTAWVTIDSFGTGSVMTVNFSITENSTGAQRTAIIRITNAEHTADFLIIQNGGAVTVDSNTITSDNNIITSDNG